MGSQPGRNAPCPCGSGKKYKKCCRQRERESEARRNARGGAASRTLDWIFQQYPAEAAAALDEGFFGGLSESERERLDELDEGLLQMVEVNSMEWLIADGVLNLEDGPKATTALALETGGPLLSAEGRAHLEELWRQPLQLYEVVESHSGEALLLRDGRDPTATPVRVVERFGSRSLSAGDVIAARIISGAPRELSGAIYDFSGFESHVHSALDEEEESEGLDPETTAMILIDVWLQRLVAPLPTIVDAATGTALTLVTDHYRVLDRVGLSRALSDCSEVVDSGEGGWTRLEEPEASRSRSLVAINPGKSPDRIELFSRSVQSADANRSWFQDLAGSHVEFVVREMTDPMAALKNMPPTEAPAPPEVEIPAELRQEIQRNAYRDWADVPIPALGNITPREAVKTERGRRKVERLLRSYETSEARASRRTGEEPMDFGFLWEEIGLDPPS
ncbi:MAG: SEC-C metal-binding domain-containing protein [Thermoanaerobaculia bacterium]